MASDGGRLPDCDILEQVEAMEMLQLLTSTKRSSPITVVAPDIKRNLALRQHILIKVVYRNDNKTH